MSNEKAAYLVIIELPEGMTPDAAKNEIRRSVEFGHSEVALMYLLPAATDVEVHGGEPPSTVGVPADEGSGLLGSEGVSWTNEDLHVAAAKEREVALDGVVSRLKDAGGDSA